MTTAKESGHGVSFFSIPLTLTSYSSTVIPVILAVWFMSYVERFAIKISSKTVKFSLVPMITTLITANVTLLILGPGTLASNVAQGGVALAIALKTKDTKKSSGFICWNYCNLWDYETGSLWGNFAK